MKHAFVKLVAVCFHLLCVAALPSPELPSFELHVVTRNRAKQLGETLSSLEIAAHAVKQNATTDVRILIDWAPIDDLGAKAVRQTAASFAALRGVSWTAEKL